MNLFKSVHHAVHQISSQHVARQRHYEQGLTQNPHYNEYMQSMQAYTRLDKVAHGHVQAWGGVH
jgi:hypothetical protein